MFTARQHRIIGGVLAGMPNLAAMAGMLTYFAYKGGHPASLALLGQFASWFTVLLIVSNIAAGLFAMAPFPRMLTAEAAARPIAAATMFGYAVAVATTPNTAWITLGFAVALGGEQLRRWHVLVTFLIPESKALESLAEQGRQREAQA